MTAAATAEPRIEREPATGAAGRAARCVGPWTVHGIAAPEGRVDVLPWPADGEVTIDGAGIAALDTSAHGCCIERHGAALGRLLQQIAEFCVAGSVGR